MSLLEEIEKLNSSNSVQQVQLSLTDPDEVLRRYAIKNLARLALVRNDSNTKQNVLNFIYSQFNDPDFGVRAAILEALQNLEPVPIQPLIEFLKSSDSLVVLLAVKALNQIRNPEAVEPLIELLYSTEDVEVFEETISTSGNLRGKKVVETFIRILENQGNELKISTSVDFVQNIEPSVLYALGDLRDQTATDIVIAAISGQHPDIAINILGKIGGERALNVLLHLFNDSYKDENLRDRAVFSLASMGAISVQPLLELMSSEEPFVRAKTAEAFGRFKVKEAINPLISALSDSDEDVRAEAGYALTNFSELPPHALAPLLKGLSDTNPYVRISSVKALEKLGDFTVLEPLQNLLNLNKEEDNKELYDPYEEETVLYAVRFAIRSLIRKELYVKFGSE